MMRASEAWRIMTEGVRFSDRIVADDDPQWVDFRIRYAERSMHGWTDGELVEIAIGLDRLVALQMEINKD